MGVGGPFWAWYAETEKEVLAGWEGVVVPEGFLQESCQDSRTRVVEISV